MQKGIKSLAFLAEMHITCRVIDENHLIPSPLNKMNNILQHLPVFKMQQCSSLDKHAS